MDQTWVAVFYIWSLILYGIVFHTPPAQGALWENYPTSSFNRKACARLRNVVLYQAPICLLTPDGKFESESEKNCRETFKATCPEFNKAGCEMYNGRPCCRLRYKARDYNWLDIFYSLQYGPGDYDHPVYDIIEIHRSIRNHESFGSRDQADFPDNVIDPKGERGLAWVEVANFSKNFDQPGFPQICKQENDTRCLAIHAYLRDKEDGLADFDGAHHVMNKSYDEIHNNARIYNTLATACKFVLINRTRLPACQVVYSRHGGTAKGGYTRVEFLEANFYNREATPITVRHAYFFQEDAEMRYQIFADN